MPASYDDLITPLTITDVRGYLLEELEAAGFPVSAWQDESAIRTIIEAVSGLAVRLSESVTTMAKMISLDTVEGKFLDVLAASRFDEARAGAIAAKFNVDMVNNGATNHSVGAGEVVLRASNGQLYTNDASDTVSANATTTMAFTAQSPGSAGNIAPQNLSLTTPLAGVTAEFDGDLTVAGADAADDETLRAQCRNKWASLKIEATEAAVDYRLKAAVPNLYNVAVDASTFPTDGNITVYCAGRTSTAGSADIAAANAELDDIFLGNGDSTRYANAVAATVVYQDLDAVIYVEGVDPLEVEALLATAWQDFISTVPLGGFSYLGSKVQAAQIASALSRVDGVVSVALNEPVGDITVGAFKKLVSGSGVDFDIRVAQ